MGKKTERDGERRMKQGKWLFVPETRDKLKTSVICSCCRKKIETEFKYLIVVHQENFKRENPYCRKCGANMEDM